MFQTVQQFIKSDAPTKSQAALSLRFVFALAFWGQLSVVVVLWLALLLFVEPLERPLPFTSEALIGLTVLQLFVALFIGRLVAHTNINARNVPENVQEGKGGALSAVIAQGVILSTPAWFALFAWLVGTELRTLLILLAVLGFYYLLGFLFAGSYTQMALSSQKKPAES